ncbi:hypothetical protein E4U54_002078 [Claviceps lovelessii]|nr:hypothetical protein E4U54_002078 [Claviceps lovelessii]
MTSVSLHQPPSRHPKPEGLSPRACAVCHRRDGLLRCVSCQVIYYCDRDHQVSHWPQHKRLCVDVRKARAKYLKEEQILRDNPPWSFGHGGNIFEDHEAVGHFYGIFETRPYMRARFGFVDTLLMDLDGVGAPVDVVQTALNHLADMVRLNRSDNMGLRSMIPPLLIRLGRDQDAYDFVKWHATTGQDPDYDWGNMSLPFLDIKGADVLEDVEPLFTTSWHDLSHTASVMLIKTRLFLDLRSLETAPLALDGKMPPELTQLVQNELVGFMLTARPELLSLSAPDTTALMTKLKHQIKILFTYVRKYNDTFWQLLLHPPTDAMATRPSSFTLRSPEEAALHSGHCLHAWAETRGALELLQSMYDEA